MTRKALGRGLDALLPSSEEKATLELPIAELSPNPFQPRQQFDDDALTELAASIKTHGLLQPVIVRKTEQGYQIIMGERRWRAARLAGLRHIPVLVRTASDDQALVMALVENLQRADLNPIDQAYAYDRLASDFGLSQESIAELVGKDRSTIANTIRLLELSQPLQELVRKQLLSAGHARALLSVVSDSIRQALAKRVIERQLSVRDLERAVQKLRTTSPLRRKVDQNVKDLEEKLSQALSTKVYIQLSGRKGKIVLSFFSLEDLDRLLDLILPQSEKAEI